MGISKPKKRDLDLFTDLTGTEVDNFCLVEINGTPVICANLAESEDDDPILHPLYAKLTPQQVELAKQAIEAGDAEVYEDEDDEKPKRRWTPS